MPFGPERETNPSSGQRKGRQLGRASKRARKVRQLSWRDNEGWLLHLDLDAVRHEVGVALGANKTLGFGLQVAAVVCLL